MSANIVDEVFNRQFVNPPLVVRRRYFIAAGCAILVHVGMWQAAQQSEPSLELWSANLATRVHAELTRQQVVEFPPPPAAPQPAIAKATPVRRVRPKALHQHPAALAPMLAVPLPASVANNPMVAEPPDAVTSDAVAPATNYSQPIALSEDEWRCPWPEAANEARIDEQKVYLRVSVDEHGTATEVAQADASEAAYGFGTAAVACARQAHFEPARDANGKPTSAAHVLIRVRFTR